MSLTNQTVLVVDDNADALSFINDTLEAAGMDVLVALEGRQALTIARQIRPDMILLDALMPMMDGFETCAALKADPNLATIPVIFMTGLSETEDIIRGLEAGGVDYLTKPIDPSELVARMRVHLNNARLTHNAQSALDSTGQHLLTVNRLGRISWATPLVYQQLFNADISESQLQQLLAPQLVSWMSTNPRSEQRYQVNGLPVALTVEWVGSADNGETLLRLIDQSQPQGAELLHSQLALTERESQVLYWIANGKTNREIAEILSLSPRTVNKHLEMIFPKLGVENRTAAAAVALKVMAKGKS